VHSSIESHDMKALILDGTEKGFSTLQEAGGLLSQSLEKRGWTVESVPLRDLRIAPCNGCFHCWVRRPGVCDQDDDGRVLTRKFAQSGSVVLVTPVLFGGYGSLLKRALERAVLPFLLPFLDKYGEETHHPLRYGRRLRLAALGGLPSADPDAEALFTEILGRNSLNCHSPLHGTAFIYDRMEPPEVQTRVAALADVLGSAS
jgi:hypothetical protein